MADAKTTEQDGNAEAKSAKQKPFKVVAVSKGFYERIRRPGDEFMISGEAAFSKKWMEVAKAEEPKAKSK